MVHTLHLDYLKEIASQWPIFVVGVFSVIVLSYIIGYVLARMQILPGSTALWGASPGSASTMVLLCEAFNADQRLVAFMAYMRVTLVACLTTTVGHHYMTGHTPPVWLTMQSPGSLLQTLIVFVIAVVIGGRLRLPSAPMLLSLFIAIVAQTYTGKTADLPLWLLAPNYLALGWVIGALHAQSDAPCLARLTGGGHGKSDFDHRLADREADAYKLPCRLSRDQP